MMKLSLNRYKLILIDSSGRQSPAKTFLRVISDRLEFPISEKLNCFSSFAIPSLSLALEHLQRMMKYKT